MSPTLYVFEHGKLRETRGRDAKVGEPWLYVWVDSQTKRALYVGEVGRSERYALKQRLRYSIGDLAGGTREQVKKNAQQTGYAIRSREVHVLAIRLPNCFMVQKKRRQLESWLHWLITVKHRQHHEQYFGFSYSVPDASNLAIAERIYARFARTLGWSAA